VAERQAVVVDLTREGWTADAIAARLGVTQRTVFRDRQKMHISRPRSKPWTEQEQRRAQELIDDGYSLMEVARTLHRHVVTVTNHGFKGQGWTAEQTGQYNALRKWEKRVFG
jgi:DNA-binding NarL/FixJ family response regulator